jgi:DNA-directed RNA polymerase subunit M/transcription elongation factor TFIIS
MKKCPECGSKEISVYGNNHTQIMLGYYKYMKCKACGHEWRELQQ